MTIKTVTTIELKDIKSVEFECDKCHTKVVYAIDKFNHPMSLCNVCKPNIQFFLPDGKEDKALINLVSLVRECSKLSAGLTMRFQIMDSSDAGHA